MNIAQRSIRGIGMFFFAAVLAVAGTYAFPYPRSGEPAVAHAAGTSVDLDGYGWSDTIGWVSFNCLTGSSTGGDVCATSNYKVSVDTTNKTTGWVGAFSGLAWSDNVGWVSFDRAITGNPPAAPFNGGTGPIAQIDWSTGALSGWARVLSGCQENPGLPVGGSSQPSCSTVPGAGPAAGGWDGWINLSGVSLDIGTGQFNGYAWGDAVVGWLDMSRVTLGVIPLPNLTASPATPTTAIAGSTVTLTADIHNIGAASTGTSFSNFFQVATAAGGGGTVTDLAPTTMSALAAGASAPATKSYTFPSIGTYSIRACADKANSSDPGVIYEGAPTSPEELDNCGTWQSVNVTAPPPTTAPTWRPLTGAPACVSPAAPYVNLFWNTVPGATGYTITRDGPQIATGISTTNYIDTPPSTGPHKYTVTAYNSGGSGPTSSQKNVVVKACAPAGTSGPVCGNGICEQGEPGICPSDCPYNIKPI